MDDRAALPDVVEEDADDLYDNAPCGYLSTLLDGTIANVNATLLNWLRYTRTDLIGRRRFPDLLTIGAQVYHETHYAPLLRMQGQVSGVTLDLRTADGSRLPVLVTSMVKPGGAGRPTLIRTMLVDAFFLGDVCGKGIAAAAVTAAARYTLRAAAVYDPDPVAVLRNLNAVLFQDYDSEAHRHCTVTFGILTPDGAGYTASVAGGGHPPALLLRADGSAEYQPTTGGALIGIMPDPPLAARRVRLVPGDTLILYSDGLTEARTTDGPGDRYGSDALLAFARKLTPTTAAAAVAALTGVLATFERATDDIAILALGMTVGLSDPAAVSR